ncbi:G-type lectin S-receptor-like serine/threonine-protein kinase At1g11410 [Lolium rigidum]|uniref:G-type lectin S-receptor-like serine/threonine-protein kinase At1g11410 n=1 Tax=Lolium rigidum TaxID=89674 RepID=UPI001F5DAA92|nr:G-type lectin S-receptor-like serine/threonine-protein kinase At1g11410 [Lolium rigidum]
MALWSGVGQAASMAQLAGVDAYGLINMIVEAVQTVKRNRETCQQLARRVKMIGDLLQRLESTQLMQHQETRNPVEQLEETLRHTYMLITSSQDSGYLYSCFMGGKQADQLREVQNDITFYLQLFPLVSFVDTSRTFEQLLNRARPLGTQDTMDELHAVHPPEHEDRLRREALQATELEDPETYLPSKFEEDQETSKVKNMEELANLFGVEKGAGLSYFSLSQILAATDNLSWRNMVGHGGFGYTYKGKLLNGLEIAVKRHEVSSYQGPAEFRAEIEIIQNLRHKNIITLLGYCVQQEEKILVYEYMPNKSLACIIADESKRKILNWSKRLQIIKGIADGILYLHVHSQMCIVHKDLKASNILLDREMNAKVSDFGLARKLTPSMTAEVLVCGTYAYADPEYVATGMISDKTDVYSFGVVLLEIIAGKLSRFYMHSASLGSLPDYARRHRKKLHKLMDPLLAAKKNERAQIMQCIKIALMCVHHPVEDRPSMSEVVVMLCSIKCAR